MHGEQQGLRLGSGSEPEEVVRYRPGEDDVRRIDWNVTARSAGEPHVWRLLAQHELETWVLVDDTPSMAFGTVALEKRDIATGVCAAIALLTAGPGNRLGTAHLNADGLQWAAPVPSRAAAHRALRRRRVGAGVAEAGPEVSTRARWRSPGSTTLGGPSAPGSTTWGLDHLGGRRLGSRSSPARLRRPAQPAGGAGDRDRLRRPQGAIERPFAWERPLRRLAATHETLVVEIVDPRELTLPDVGAVTLVDPESGRRREVWTSDRKVRDSYAAMTAAHRTATADAVRSARAGHVLLRTDRDWVRDLARHVHGRPLRHDGLARTGARA